MAQEYTGEKDFFGKDKYGFTFGKNVQLNKSTIIDVFKEERGDFKSFISGATANSYAYESLYSGNPGEYQTIIIGENDICESANDLYKYLGDMASPSQEEIQQFREEGRVNTYGETAPFMGEEVLKLLDAQNCGKVSPYITFGVDRIRVRYFND